MPDDEIIADEVVRIRPDLVGFEKLQKQIDGLTKSIEGAVKIVADATGFNASARSALRAQAQLKNRPTYAVKLVADATGFNASARVALAKLPTLQQKVSLVADDAVDGPGAAIVKALGKETRIRKRIKVKADVDLDVDEDEAGEAIAGVFKKVQGDVGKTRFLADSINRQISTALNSAFLLNKETERLATVRRSALDREQDVEKAHQRFLESVNQAHGRAIQDNIRFDKAATVSAEQEANKRVAAAEAESRRVAAAVRQSAKERSDAYKAVKGNSKFIDYGGQGIRPMNLLYTIVAAMTPALFAMGSSALQASTSLAALAAAGVGTGLILGGLVIAFKGITDLWSLRSQVQNEMATDAANASQTAVQNALQELQATNNLLDAQLGLVKAEKDLHDARVDAKQDLIDLKQKVADLQNQQKADTLTLAEKEEARARTYRSFFSTALDKARADQDVNDARTARNNTNVDLAKNKAALTDSVKKGVEGSDKVTDAKDAARRARQRLAETKLQNQVQDLGGAAGKASSAQSQLNKKLAEASPALRALYKLLDINSERFKSLGNQIQQAFLPGFTQALDKMLEKPPGGVSTLQFFTDQASELGRILGKYVGILGEWTQSPFFRKAFGTIQDNNADSLDILGQAGQKLADAILRITAAASPLTKRFAKGLDKFATWFDDLIKKADESGSLQKFFMEAGDEFGRWVELGKQILRLFGGLFKAAEPSGGSLVDQITKFVKGMADFTNSPEGQKKLKEIFEYFEKLPYGDISRFFAGMVTTFAAIRAFKFVTGSPLSLFLSALTAFAAADPKAAGDLLGGITDFITRAGGALASNPELTTFLLAAAGLYKLKGALGLKVAIPAIDSLKNTLTKKFKILDKVFGGESSTGTMTVKAAVVNVYGGAGATTPPGVLPGGKPSKTGLTSPGGVISGVIAAALLAAGFGSQGSDGASQGKGFGQPVTDFIKDPSVGGFGDALAIFSPIYWASYGLSAAIEANNGFANGLKAGVAIVYKSFFSWVGGLVDWVKKLLGIKSPSTVFAEIGGNVVQGLVDGFTNKWTQLWTQLTAFITTNITDPLTDTFGAIGIGIRTAFIAPFNALVSKLAAPVKAALTWINSNLIGPLNVLLSGLGVGEISLLSIGTASGGTGSAVGGAVGDVAGDVGKILKRADGGTVPGYSPHSRADNIPALLTANEYVQPVDAVKHYGTDFMEAVRAKKLPRYADGGVVGGLIPAVGSNIASKVITGALKGLSLKQLAENVIAKATSFFGSDPGGGTPVGDQALAELAESTARSLGATDKQLVALIEAGIVESGLRNINYGDRDSVGFLQQRPSQGWGTPTQLTDPRYATTKFIQAAKRVDKASYSAGQLAQAVQRSAYPARYPAQEANAIAILNRAAPLLAGYTGGTGGADRYTGKIDPRLGKVDNVTTGIYQAILGAHASHPEAKVTSSYRPGSITTSGNLSYHARNPARAADFAPPSAGLFNYFAGRYGNARELIYSPAGENQIKNGRKHYYTGAVRADHFDHVHLALNKGGQVKARKYDTGGGLPPGYTLAFNGTGRTETVRTAKQEAQLGGPMRLDKRDIALLAHHIARANSTEVNMDGRKVAEITNGYTYLPAGV